MADEIEYAISLTMTKNGKTFDIAAVTTNADAGNAMASIIASITTSGGNLNIGTVAAPGVAYFRNLDATNYIEIKNGAAGDVLLKLLAGQNALIHCAAGVTLYAIANTSACLLEYVVFNT